MLVERRKIPGRDDLFHERARERRADDPLRMLHARGVDERLAKIHSALYVQHRFAESERATQRQPYF
ncbi:hypothetical protein BPC006_I0790 [Burkholderia pseudomallei BPC006]|nr:hypothetical protein BPC006_I0790 [Burkholderia pseudomallei BPC006]